MSPELEIRAAADTLRRRVPHTRLSTALTDLLDAVADICINMHAEPYAGTWQGRGLAIARALGDSGPSDAEHRAKDRLAERYPEAYQTLLIEEKARA